MEKNKEKYLVLVLIFCVVLAFGGGYLLGDSITNNDKNIDIKDIDTSQEIVDETGELANDFDFEEIVEALNSNPNLTDEEKELFLSSQDIFADGYGYYNKEKLIENLKSLKIVYVSERDGTVAGIYSKNDNCITIYGSDKFDEKLISVYTHEFCHMLQETKMPDFIDFKWSAFLLEGVNVIMNNEYYGINKHYDSAYPFNRNIIKILCEILGSDILKKYNYDMNADNVIEALAKLDNDYDRANSLFDYFDTYWSLFWDENSSEYSIFDIENMILNELAYYYKVRFNRSIEKDLIVLSYFDYDKFKDTVLGSNVTGYSTSGHPYFNKRKSNDLTVKYVNSNKADNYKLITVDEGIKEGIINFSSPNSYSTEWYVDVEYIDNEMYLKVPTEFSYLTINESNRYLNK